MANDSQTASAQIVVGLFVVAIGVLFLLDNLGLFPFGHAIGFWPLALIVGGAALMVSDNKRSSRRAGTILAVVGVVLLLQRLGFLDVSWRVVWPLMMIVAGGLILYRTLGPGRVHGRASLDQDEVAADSLIDVTAILGGVERSVTAKDFRGGDITALLGGCELDLRSCGLAGEAKLDVFAFWGGITIKVPADWTVIMKGQPVLGGFSQKTATPPDNSKRLVVSGTAVMGGVEVRN